MGSARGQLLAFWQGESFAEVAERRNTDPEGVEDRVLHEIADLKEQALRALIDRAEEGDAAAVVWLEDHGLLEMPRREPEAHIVH